MKLQPGTPQEVGMSPQRVRHIADLAAGWVEQGITPALIVLAARRGVIVLHEAYGRLGPEEDDPPLERNTLFPLASLTKPITATAAMILVEDGLLGLNRPVSWYVPEMAGPGKERVMVHHLLTHTSGFRDEEVHAHAEQQRGSVEIPPPEKTQHPWVHQELHLRYDAPLCVPPGTEMSYSDCGYELLGEIVRRVSGQSLAGFCRKRIFQPLGMVDTTYIVPDSMRHRIVQRSKDAPGADGFVTWKVVETPWASSGAYSTALDMAIFGQMFLNRGTYGEARVLSPASIAEMTRNQIPGIGARSGDELFPEASWGLGWSVRGNKKSVGYNGTLQSPQTFSHSGAGGVLLWVDPAYEILGAYFSVSSEQGIPAGVRVAEGDRAGLMARRDLFIDAVTAAVVDL